MHSVVPQAITRLINSAIDAYFHTDVYKLYKENIISIIAISKPIYLYATSKY